MSIIENVKRITLNHKDLNNVETSQIDLNSEGSKTTIVTTKAITETVAITPLYDFSTNKLLSAHTYLNNIDDMMQNNTYYCTLASETLSEGVTKTDDYNYSINSTTFKPIEDLPTNINFNHPKLDLSNLNLSIKIVKTEYSTLHYVIYNLYDSNECLGTYKSYYTSINPCLTDMQLDYLTFTDINESSSEAKPYLVSEITATENYYGFKFKIYKIAYKCNIQIRLSAMYGLGSITSTASNVYLTKTTIAPIYTKNTININADDTYDIYSLDPTYNYDLKYGFIAKYVTFNNLSNKYEIQYSNNLYKDDTTVNTVPSLDMIRFNSKYLIVGDDVYLTGSNPTYGVTFQNINNINENIDPSDITYDLSMYKCYITNNGSYDFSDKSNYITIRTDNDGIENDLVYNYKYDGTSKEYTYQGYVSNKTDLSNNENFDLSVNYYRELTDEESAEGEQKILTKTFTYHINHPKDNKYSFNWYSTTYKRDFKITFEYDLEINYNSTYKANLIKINKLIITGEGMEYPFSVTITGDYNISTYRFANQEPFIITVNNGQQSIWPAGSLQLNPNLTITESGYIIGSSAIFLNGCGILIEKNDAYSISLDFIANVLKINTYVANVKASSGKYYDYMIENTYIGMKRNNINLHLK